MVPETICDAWRKIIGASLNPKSSFFHVAKVRQSYYLDCKILLLRGDFKWAILK